MIRNPFRPAVVAASLCSVLVATESASALQVFSDPGDGFIEFRTDPGVWPQVHPSFNGSGGEGFFANVGEWFGTGLTSAVLPFELPNLGPAVDPFASASLGVHLFEIGTANVTPVDLYAVRTASTPTLLATDYYSGATLDANATLIQEDFLTPSSVVSNPAAPNNFTSIAGDAALLAYLNGIYAGGAGAGDFVFLRLSWASDDTLAAGFDAYKITSRNAGGGSGDYPVLMLTLNALPGDTDNDGVIELSDYNPIRDNWLQTNASFGMQLSRTDGDLNADGMVSVEDFREWKDAFLFTGGSEAQVVAAFASLGVPEPSGALTAAFGVIGTGWLRSRRRRV